MSDHGVHVEQHRIVIRNHGIAAVHIGIGLLQLVGILLLFNVRFDGPVLIVVGVVVGVPKVWSWRRKWRRRMVIDASDGITIINFWNRYELTWSQITELRVRSTTPLLSSQARAAELAVWLGDRGFVAAAATTSAGRKRRNRLAEVVRANPLIVRRPHAELAATAEALIAWDHRTTASARLDRVAAARESTSALDQQRWRRWTAALVAVAAVATVAGVGGTVYLLAPLSDTTARHVPSGDELSRGLAGLRDPCDGNLEPPKPFTLSTPLETVALRSGGQDIWEVHAKFDMAWNFAQHVTLQALDSSSGYVHDIPGSLGLSALFGRHLTLVIGDGNMVVEIACDGSIIGSVTTSG